MASYSNQTKNTASYEFQEARGAGLLWEDASQQWQDMLETWVLLAANSYSNQSLNSASYVNITKN
jgi:hypothetical protein